jgi:cell division protein FtsW
MGFLDPFGHRNDVGYQIAESLMSFGSGGITGVGIGDGRQKLFFLPEAHTDFFSAIVGEELGFIGVLALILAYSLLVVRGLRAAFRAADVYGSYLAAGITLFLGIQAFTNLAVAMGMLPTKGLVLPFMSYGGSSLLVNCAALGVLLNVTRPRAIEDEGPLENSKKSLAPNVALGEANGGTA